MHIRSFSILFVGLGLLAASCSNADDSASEGDPITSAGGSGGAASGASGSSTAGTSASGSGGAAGGAQAGSSGQAGSSAAGAAGSAAGEGGAGAGQGGNSAGGDPFGGGAGQGDGGQSGAGPSGSGGSPFGGGGSPFGGGGDAGSGGSDAGAGGAVGGAGGSAGNGGSGAVPGWTCSASLYKSGGSIPACNCDCGAYDPDCDDPFSYVKGCGKGQTCDAEGKCAGAVLSTPSSWVCGSAYYAIGGPKPVCDCGCGAPDPDCDLPYPTYNLTKCKKGQTCGKDGTCQGPELAVPATWTCAPSKFAEGKTSGTCDCDCGAYDPDCNDVHLKIAGCGYKQTCDKDGKCSGDIAPAPAGWDCASNSYSDGKICNCACGIKDPDCDLDVPDDCGPDAFCGSITNDCIPKAN